MCICVISECGGPGDVRWRSVCLLACTGSGGLKLKALYSLVHEAALSPGCVNSGGWYVHITVFHSKSLQWCPELQMFNEDINFWGGRAKFRVLVQTTSTGVLMWFSETYQNLNLHLYFGKVWVETGSYLKRKKRTELFYSFWHTVKKWKQKSNL